MRFFSSCTLFIALIAFSGRACHAADTATPNDCDRLVANPFDAEALSTGVPFAEVRAHAPQAVAACASALEAAPSAPRYSYQYGRALEASGAPEKALKNYLDAAQAGYVIAMVRVTDAYNYGGLPGIEKNPNAALGWGRRAATSGNPVALAALAHVLAEDEDTRPEAGALYLKAAEGGFPHAFFDAGSTYERGVGLPRDRQKAAYWFRRAADEDDDARAMVHLAFLYQAGLGVPEDRATGLTWLTKAAQTELTEAAQTDPENLLLLAREYLSERFGPKNSDKAIELLKKAADGGSIEAMKQLAELYGEGVFVAKDDQASISWYQKAIEAGDKSSTDILFSIYADQNSALFDPKLAAEYMMKLMISEPREVNWAQKLSKSLDPRTISALQQLLANRGLFHDEIDGRVTEALTAALADYVKSGSKK